MDKYRIIEVTQYGKTWYELQENETKSDYRESWKVWTKVKGSSNFQSVEEARQAKKTLVQSVRKERVVE